MADGSSALGGPEIAGAWVSKTGTAKRVTGNVAGAQIGGIVGSVVGAGISKGAQPPAAGTPDFGTYGYLAVGSGNLVLVKAKQGLMGMKLTDEVVARASKSDVASATLGEGKVSSPLTISFRDGGSWELEVARARRKGAEQVVAELGG